MLETPRWLQQSFTIHFPRVERVRRAGNDVEDILEGAYLPPQVIPVPDDVEPEMPRLILSSRGGFSSILVSQVSATLNVTFSEDWQRSQDRRRGYLLERVPLLFKAASAVSQASELSYAGTTSRVRATATIPYEALLERLSKRLLAPGLAPGLYDFQLRLVRPEQELYFSNLTIAPFREWRTSSPEAGVLQRLPDREAVAWGVEILGDFNDRRGYNEGAEPRTSIDRLEPLIDGAARAIENILSDIEGEA